MYKISGEITGVSDVLFNKMTPTTENSLRKGSSGGKFTDKQRLDETSQMYHVDSDGNAIIDSWMFKQVLAAGATKGNIKTGRKSLAPFLIATVFVEGNIYLNPNKPDYVHERPGRRPPKTGAACLVKRPAFRAGWTASFTLNVTDDRIDSDSIRASLVEAGTLAGLGSWRPEYGRFIVTKWDIDKKG